MKVREAQLSKDTSSPDPVSGGSMATTSAPPQRCDTSDKTCGLAVMVVVGGGEEGGGAAGALQSV